MARTLNGNRTGRAAQGVDDIEVVTDYSLKSRQYYLDEIAAEEEFIRTHLDHPQRFEASANISYCQDCLAKLEELEEQEQEELCVAIVATYFLGDWEPFEPETVADAIAAGEIGAPHGDEKLVAMIAEIEERYPENWKHPARSDRQRYKQNTVYWNGDI